MIRVNPVLKCVYNGGGVRVFWEMFLSLFSSKEATQKVPFSTKLGILQDYVRKNLKAENGECIKLMV